MKGRSGTLKALKTFERAEELFASKRNITNLAVPASLAQVRSIPFQIM